MRVSTLLSLAAAVSLATWTVCAATGDRGARAARDGAGDEEEYRGRPLYHDYGLLRQAGRADDVFDDYGHLRFGRSDD